MSDKREAVLAKAHELFGWASGLGGFDEAIHELADFIESQQAQGEPVGIVEPSDHQTVAALTDPYHPLRMAVAETSPGSIQSLPDGTKLYTAPPNPAAVPAGYPWIIENLSYHKWERDDLTIDDCLSYLSEGWEKVHGRTERELVLQITALLAEAPAPAEPEEPDHD